MEKYPIYRFKKATREEFIAQLPRASTLVTPSLPTVRPSECKYYFYMTPSNEIAGGFRLVTFKESIRIMSVFILAKWQHQGLVPKMLLLLFDSFQRPVYTRSLRSMREYWDRYGYVVRGFGSAVEFKLDKQQIKQYVHEHEKTG